MERIADKLEGVKYEDLQQFVTDSAWNHVSLFEKITKEVEKDFRKLKEDSRIGLIIDESCFSKKGDKSVGVSRQYNGRQGKVDNCQVAVYTAMVQQDEVCLSNTWLYLPEDWTNNEKRCIEAGIPTEDIIFRTKGQIVAEMAQDYFSNGHRAYWVGGDSVYGDSPELKPYLDHIGQKYVLDISPSFKFYMDDPVENPDAEPLSCTEIWKIENLSKNSGSGKG